MQQVLKMLATRETASILLLGWIYRVVITKTEVSVLNEFIARLEDRLREYKGSDGVVLIE